MRDFSPTEVLLDPEFSKGSGSGGLRYASDPRFLAE
jgi:hypothetical protein